MNKISLVFVFWALSFISTAIAEDSEKEKQQNLVYWAASEDTVTASFPERRAVNFPIPQRLSAIQPFPFSEAIENQLVNIILKFDSLAASSLAKTKQLTMDEIEISVAMTTEGKLAIVSGKTEGSVTIKLKNKRSAGIGVPSAN